MASARNRNRATRVDQIIARYKAQLSKALALAIKGIVQFPADLGASLRRDIPDYGDGKAGDKIARVIDEALALTSA